MPTPQVGRFCPAGLCAHGVKGLVSARLWVEVAGAGGPVPRCNAASEGLITQQRTGFSPGRTHWAERKEGLSSEAKSMRTGARSESRIVHLEGLFFRTWLYFSHLISTDCINVFVLVRLLGFLPLVYKLHLGHCAVMGWDFCLCTLVLF